MKPFIDQSFWSDPDIEAAKTGVKLAALWLITNTQTSLLGVCGASSARFTFETGLPAEALDATLQALPKSFRRFGGVIFLRNYMRHQFGSGETLTKNNFFKALKTLFRAIKDDELKAAVLSEYPEFDSSTTPSQGLPKPKEGKEGEGQEREGKIRARRARPLPSFGHRIPKGKPLPTLNRHGLPTDAQLCCLRFSPPSSSANRLPDGQKTAVSSSRFRQHG